MYLRRCIISVILLQIIELLRADDREEDARRLMESLTQAQSDISSMMNTINSLDGLLSTHQKRACNLGINSHHCALADYDRLMQSHEYLSSGHSPGKRSSTGDDKTEVLTKEELKKLLDDIVKKRTDLNNIRALLTDAIDNIIQNSKRTCTVELGGACRTEWASSLADAYWYLKSHHSPGRRRRSYRKPVSIVKLFNSRIHEIKNRNSL